MFAMTTVRGHDLQISQIGQICKITHFCSFSCSHIWEKHIVIRIHMGSVHTHNNADSEEEEHEVEYNTSASTSQQFCCETTSSVSISSTTATTSLSTLLTSSSTSDQSLQIMGYLCLINLILTIQTQLMMKMKLFKKQQLKKAFKQIINHQVLQIQLHQVIAGCLYISYFRELYGVLIKRHRSNIYIDNVKYNNSTNTDTMVSTYEEPVPLNTNTQNILYHNIDEKPIMTK